MLPLHLNNYILHHYFFTNNYIYIIHHCAGGAHATAQLAMGLRRRSGMRRARAGGGNVVPASSTGKGNGALQARAGGGRIARGGGPGRGTEKLRETEVQPTVPKTSKILWCWLYCSIQNCVLKGLTVTFGPEILQYSSILWFCSKTKILCYQTGPQISSPQAIN